MGVKRKDPATTVAAGPQVAVQAEARAQVGPDESPEGQARQGAAGEAQAVLQ